MSIAQTTRGLHRMCATYPESLFPDPYPFRHAAWCLFPLCPGAFLPLSSCLIYLSAILDKRSVTEIGERLANFCLGIHHERSVGNDGLIDRRTGDEHNAHG